MIKAILFDLGNVLINYSFDRAFVKWAELTSHPKELFKSHFNYEDPELHQLEKGNISPQDYHKILSEKLEISWEYSHFVEGWNYVNIGVNEDLFPVLETLKKKFPLYVLSNTNLLHANNITSRFPKLFSYFKKNFFSHELHARKPDREIFDQIITSLHLEASELLFIDDLIANVQGAQNIGITAILMESNTQLISKLATMGLLN